MRCDWFSRLLLQNKFFYLLFSYTRITGIADFVIGSEYATANGKKDDDNQLLQEELV